MSVQIIYLNGPTSSGKTTLTKALQHAFEKPFLHLSVDRFIDWMPIKVNDWLGGHAPHGFSWKQEIDPSGEPIQVLQVGPYAEEILDTFRQVVLSLARIGHHLIIDDFTFGANQLETWRTLLDGFSVLFVAVNAPLHILEERELHRHDRIRGSARAQFHKMVKHPLFDLEIDTYHQTLSENIDLISKLALRPLPFEIRPLISSDIPKIIDRFTFPSSTTHDTTILWNKYLREHNEKLRHIAILEQDGKILGYAGLLRKARHPFFREENIPEIHPIHIDEHHRGHGLGTALIRHLENLAKEEGYSKIGISVGLAQTCGPAQKLYSKLGYLLDGSGATYQGIPTIGKAVYPLDDALSLWLYKSLRTSI